MKATNIVDYSIAFTWLITTLFSFPVTASQGRKLTVPYVSTPYIVVDHMLEMAGVGPGDYVIDLGSGDGRIVNEAVMRGANGHGVDLDPERVAEANANASEQHLRRRVLFLEQDVFDTDVSGATVVTMYLLPTINVKLRSTLIEQLEPGSRIVSHDFDMGDWKPDNWKSVEVRNRRHIIYFWIVPASIDGKWVSIVEDTRFTIVIDQQFQEVDIRLRSENPTIWSVHDTLLSGDRIAFTADGGKRRYIFNGGVHNDKIEGIVQIYDLQTRRLATWTAERE